MKTKLTKGILLILSLLCILCIPVTPVYAAQQGTDGSELQVVKAEQLEIQLGTSWSGVEFQLKTDAGVYPGTVKVGTDGVLRLEIGGSSQYILYKFLNLDSGTGGYGKLNSPEASSCHNRAKP